MLSDDTWNEKKSLNGYRCVLIVLDLLGRPDNEMMVESIGIHVEARSKFHKFFNIDYEVCRTSGKSLTLFGCLTDVKESQIVKSILSE